jgi:hypothetical protein
MSSYQAIQPGGVEAAAGSGTDGSFALKVILSVLACLLLLNAFLYFKLARLETSASSPSLISPQTFTFSG